MWCLQSLNELNAIAFLTDEQYALKAFTGKKTREQLNFEVSIRYAAKYLKDSFSQNELTTTD